LNLGIFMESTNRWMLKAVESMANRHCGSRNKTGGTRTAKSHIPNH
jgi:hypothetical protein